MRRIVVAFLIIAGLLFWCGPNVAIAADPEPRLVLAPSGVLRAALYPGTPTSILPDPKSGGPRGVGYDLGKELARRLGVPYVPVVFAKNAEVLEAVKNGSADVAFTNASAARARDMDFGPPFLEIELGYLVPRGSALTAPADVDAAGLRRRDGGKLLGRHLDARPQARRNRSRRDLRCRDRHAVGRNA